MKPLPFDVLHRDEHLLAVAKPAGIPTVPDESGDASLFDLVQRADVCAMVFRFGQIGPIEAALAGGLAAPEPHGQFAAPSRVLRLNRHR